MTDTRRAACDRIRANLSALGYDVRHISDDDIEQGAVAMAQTIRGMGFSLAEVESGLTALHKAARGAPYDPDRWPKDVPVVGAVSSGAPAPIDGR